MPSLPGVLTPFPPGAGGDNLRGEGKRAILMKLFVLGDAGIDNYLIGKVRGLSAEAPIPVLDIGEPTWLPGMGANVLGNLQTLGADVEFIWGEDPNFPIKTRLVTADGHQIARFDKDDYCKPYDRADLLPLIDASGIIVTDYGKGAITDHVAGLLANATAPLFVDTKRDPAPWLQSNAILFPNKAEYEQYKSKYEWFPRVVLKQGAEGISFVEYGKVVATRPAWAKRVNCVNGAGDTVIAAFAMAYLQTKGNINLSLDVANAAAANVVEQDFLNRWTTAEAVTERITNEVPEKAYNPFQTQYSSGGSLAGSTHSRTGLPQLQNRPASGWPGAVGSECDSFLAAEIIRAVADAMEDEWAI